MKMLLLLLLRATQTPGNPKFLGRLSVLVREAETRLMFAINFDFNVEVATSMVIIQCNELGLTTEQADRDSSVFAVRKTAFDVAKARCGATRCCVGAGVAAGSSQRWKHAAGNWCMPCWPLVWLLLFSTTWFCFPCHSCGLA